MVRADSDVLDAQGDDAAEPAPERGIAEVNGLHCVARGKSQQLAGFVVECARSPIGSDYQQSVTIGSLVNDAVIGGGELSGHGIELLVDRKADDDIGAVADLEALDLTEHQGPFHTLAVDQGQVLLAVGVYRSQVGLCPLDCSLGIGRDIESQHFVQVRHRVFDSPFDCGVIDVEIHVALRPAVSAGNTGGHQYEHDRHAQQDDGTVTPPQEDSSLTRPDRPPRSDGTGPYHRLVCFDNGISWFSWKQPRSLSRSSVVPAT